MYMLFLITNQNRFIAFICMPVPGDLIALLHAALQNLFLLIALVTVDMAQGFPLFHPTNVCLNGLITAVVMLMVRLRILADQGFLPLYAVLRVLMDRLVLFLPADQLPVHGIAFGIMYMGGRLTLLQLADQCLFIALIRVPMSLKPAVCRFFHSDCRKNQGIGGTKNHGACQRTDYPLP